MTLPRTDKRFRTAKPITVPVGSTVVFVAKMKREVTNMAQVIVKVGKHTHFDWTMFFDDALEAGLIEEVKE